MPDNKIDQLGKGLEDLIGSSGPAIQALNEINSAILKTGRGAEAAVGTIKGLSGSLKMFSDGVGEIIGVTPGLGVLGDAFKGLGGTIESVGNLIGGLGEQYIGAVRATDELSRTTRNLQATNFTLAAQFGKTFDEAKKFTDFMLISSEELSKADLGYQNFAEDTIPMVQALANQRLSFEKMQETVESTAGSYELYSIAVLQAQSLGLSMQEYSSLLSDAILKQGMSTQEATEQLSIYGDIAGSTGLTVGVVANSLNSLGNSFRKMGLDATFGESFLRGFADSLDETGIGIENAAELAQTFGQAMAGLSTDYGSAFVTAMRGGMDRGSGGALGAGIQMQAAMMDPNTNQGELGRDIAGAVRDTLASFTGGQIVTVSEAAESRDPRIEQIYYTQTKLLESMYGITDSQDQARTLELLERMSAAQATGDQEAMALIGEDLQEALGMRRETMSNEEKLNALATAQLAQAVQQTQLLGTAVSLLGEDMIGVGAGMLEGAVDSLSRGLPNINTSIEEALAKIESGEADNISEVLTGVKLTSKTLLDNMKSLEISGNRNTPELNTKAELIQALEGIKLSITDSELSSDIRALTEQIKEMLTKVNSGGRFTPPGASG